MFLTASVFVLGRLLIIGSKLAD